MKKNIVLWAVLSILMITGSGCRDSFSASNTPSLNENTDLGTIDPGPEDQDPARTPGQSKYFRLMIQDNAANSIVIGYHAPTTDLNQTSVYYDNIDHGQQVEKYKFRVKPDLIRPYLEMNNAFVRLKNLTANTAYYFVVEDSAGISHRFWFKTAPNQPTERLSIIAGGDSRNNRTPRQAANLLVSKLRPHAVLFSGDMTGGGSAAEWKEWFQDWQLTIAADGRIFPILAARGNHESSNAMIEQLFDTTPGVYYAVNFGNNLLRVYTLNTESGISGAQTNWLQSDLADNEKMIWKFAQYHRPMRPHNSGKSEGTNQYKYWSDLFYKYRMNVVNESDTHTVKTTWPLRPSTSQGSAEGFIRDDKEGTVFIGEGCWGAPLRSNDDPKAWTRSHGKFNHFNWIFVDQNKVEIRVIKVDNAKSVGSVSDNNVFQPPANLDIWSPAEGSVITLPARSSQSLNLAQSNHQEMEN